MAYDKPQILEIPSPVGIDKVIASLQASLSGITWLTKVFGRAFELKETDPQGAVLRIPKVYDGSGEYYNVLPNDALEDIASQVFFAVRGPEESREWSPGAMAGSKERTISLIFWANLQQIDPSKDYIFTEELHAEIEAAIKLNPYVMEFLSYYDERVEDVFDGYISNAGFGRYNVDDVNNKYLMHPWGGFRMDFRVGYPDTLLNC